MERCRGFWAMCGCEACRKADRALDAQLDGVPKEQRAAATLALMASALAALDKRRQST